MNDLYVSELTVSSGTYKIKDENAQAYIDEQKRNIVSVKDYGAKGDGATDDTQSILNAISALNNGDILFFPKGDYIVYNDYVDNHNTNGYDYEKIIKLVGLKNIAIIGEDRFTSKIRPSYQRVSSIKYNYPCTLSLYNCNNITIKNITIESKGESYGDTDGVTSQSPLREQQMMTNGGQPLLILASSNVRVENCDFRLCGSVGCVYGSNSTYITMVNCFTNAMSLGYAGICFDNYLKGDENKDYIFYVENCQQWKESLYQPENNQVPLGSQIYSGKCGILSEGSEIKFKMYVSDYMCKDTYGNNADRQLGCAVIVAQTELILNGMYCENVSCAVQFQTIHSELELHSLITGVYGKCRRNGIGLYESSNNGNNTVTISSCKIYVDGSEKYGDNPYTAQNSIIQNKAYTDTVFIIDSCDFESPEYGLYFPASCGFIVSNSRIVAPQIIKGFSGPKQHLMNCDLEFTNQNTIDLNTVNGEGNVGYLNVVITGNIFKCTNSESQNAIKIANTNGNKDLIQEMALLNNVLINCYLSASALTEFSRTARTGSFVIKSKGLAGSYTLLTIEPNGNDAYFDCYVIDDEGTFRKSEGGANNNQLYIVGGDLQSKFTVGKRYFAYGG